MGRAREPRLPLGQVRRQQRHGMRLAPAESDDREQEDHDAVGLVDVVAHVLKRAGLAPDHGDARRHLDQQDERRDRPVQADADAAPALRRIPPHPRRPVFPILR